MLKRVQERHLHGISSICVCMREFSNDKGYKICQCRLTFRSGCSVLTALIFSTGGAPLVVNFSASTIVVAIN